MNRAPYYVVAAFALLALATASSQVVNANDERGSNSSSKSKKLIYATTNPTPALAGDSIVGLDKKLGGVVSTSTNFGTVLSIQSIETDKSGRAFATFDNAAATATTPASGGVLAIDNVADVGNDERIVGAATGIVSPKGVEIVSKKDAVIVSDVGARALHVFADDASGNVAPQFSVTNLGSSTTRTPWDADYDASSDRLFVAATDGVVLVYDNFFTAKGVSGPNREITPAVAGVKASVNLHGVAYNNDEDSLVVSDVGSATVATDGQLFMIADASTANGVTNVAGRVSGANSRLGNPVDIDLKGEKLFVAEKSNDLIMRFDDILDLEGESNVAADKSVSVTKPESVSVN